MADFETFTLLFRADSSQLKKEVDDVKKKTNETTEVFKDAEEQTKKTDNGFVNLAKSLGTLATAYFSVGAIAGNFRSSMAHTTELSNFSRELDVNVSELDAWGKAIKNVGGTASAFQSSLKQLAFQRFNSSGTAALNALPIFADQLKKLGPVQGQIYGQEQLGLDPGTIAFLLQGGEAVRKAIEEQKRLGVVTPEDVELQRKFNESIGKLSDATDELSRVILRELIPGLSNAIDRTTNDITALSEYKNNPDAPFPWHVFPYTKSILNNIGLSNLGENKEKMEEEISSNPLNQDWTKDYYEKFKNEQDENGKPISYHLPSLIPSVTNSQAASVTTGPIHINTPAQDAKGIAATIIGEIGSQGKTLLAHFQQSNAYFDSSVVV